MIKAILNWSEAKTEELVSSNSKTKHGLAKAAGLGLLEGFIDTCALLGAYGFVLSVADHLVRIGK